MSTVIRGMNDTPLIFLGLVLLVFMVAAAAGGYAFRVWLGHHGKGQAAEGQEDFVVSAVLGLLALLMGFTFSLAIDRFETRRELVVEEANAIGSAYLQAQLLAEPHRTRLSRLLIEYTDGKLAIASARLDQLPALSDKDDALLTQIWAATAAAFDSIKGMDLSSAFVDSMNHLVSLDATRRAAWMARVPGQVFLLLLIYLVVTAAVLGYALSGARGRFTAVFLLALLIMSLLLMIDIDRPTSGGITESQAPMQRLRKSFAAQPISVYDRWRTKPEATGQ